LQFEPCSTFKIASWFILQFSGFTPGVELSATPHNLADPSISGTTPSLIDAKHLAEAVKEIVSDMQSGACAATISQTVQVLDLGDGRKAAVIVTITTENDQFL
jgi:hypothetical protein